jgi:hypothetical protein
VDPTDDNESWPPTKRGAEDSVKKKNKVYSKGGCHVKGPPK